MLWYISFATDTEFLGATVVAASSDRAAFDEATRLGLNPGGQAAIIELPPEAENEPDARAMLNRLVGKEEMLAMGGKRHADCPQEVQDAFDAEATNVCAECNPVDRK